MATTVTKLFPTGILQSSVELDEHSTNNIIRVSLGGVFAGEFDEVTIHGTGPAERRTRSGTYMVSGHFDEYTLRPIPDGEVIFDTPGTYTWTCPDGVTSVCAVAVGGGGGGGTGGSNMFQSYSGGGGGLGWKNNIPVIPGQTYTVVVGAGGVAAAEQLTSPMNGRQGGSGGDSYFISITNVKGGGAPSGTGQGGTYTGDGGGNGGNAGPNTGGMGGGGGGAGGYTGKGGNGGTGWVFGTTGYPIAYTAGYDGSGGGGGGAGGTGYDQTTVSASGGGGVGLFGQGTNGIGGTRGPQHPGTAGSSGENGFASGSGGGFYVSAGRGGKYGGGGGGAGYGLFVYAAAGGKGAVRIIWGSGRSFPLNAS
jgi:hypothetical protein